MSAENLQPVLAVLCAVVGLAVGSFLNVVIHRVPRGESVVRPASRCPRCQRPLRTRDNVPVLGWLLLRGRCRHCGNKISVRYPVVEVLAAVVFVVLALHLGASWQLPAFLYLGAISVALGAIDIDVFRLPNSIVLPSYAVVAVLLLAPGLVLGHGHDVLRAVLGGLVLYGVFFVLMAVYPGGMGFGDVKLAGVLGLYLGWLGWGSVVVGAFLGFVLGAVWGLALMVAGRASRKSRIPFGPFLLAGALVGVLLGQSLSSAYLDLARG